MLNLTPVVKNLLIINVIVFFAQHFAPAMEFAGCFGSQYTQGYTQDAITGYLSMWNIKTACFKPYQLFTYMFVHGGFGHIFMNMLGLIFFGPILESYWGAKRFTLFYMITGIGAGIFNILLDAIMGSGFSFMLGASGAVYGVLTAFGLTFPNMELRLLFLPVSFKAKYMVMVTGFLTIYSSFKASAGDNTAHFAHLGGIVIAIIIVQIWRSRGIQ
jgi:membrane associated rhomboid family serine protease